MRTVDLDVDLNICTSGLTGSVYSKASDGTEGGDIYFLSVCSSDKLTRIAVADVNGHGGRVSELSGWVYNILQEYMNTLDGNQVLVDLNSLISSRGFEALTTAVVVGFYLGDSKLYFSYAGHPPVLLKRGNAKRWIPLLLDAATEPSNLPLGVLPAMHYDQTETPLIAGDRFLLYTDGVSECPDGNGVGFGEERLLRLLEMNGNRSLADIKGSVIAELRDYAEQWPSVDDVTLMAFEVR
jgi:sigma-B regulation protein RsbU (phosphoserine phosphatase)